MSDTIQAISRALGADVQGLNAVSHNVANLATPGFQGVRLLPDFANALAQEQRVQLHDGPLKQTGRSLDLALRGDGFFQIKRGDEVLLTRAGHFVRRADGVLATLTGDEVMTDAGPLALPEQDVRVDGAGVIWQGEQRLAQLAIAGIAEPARLQATGNGYRYDGTVGTWNGTVQQGAIEQSNVDAAEETQRLIELSRHAESVQRAISIYDRTLDTGINRIGDN